jgi:hypothetical protein
VRGSVHRQADYDFLEEIKRRRIKIWSTDFLGIPV